MRRVLGHACRRDRSPAFELRLRLVARAPRYARSESRSALSPRPRRDTRRCQAVMLHDADGQRREAPSIRRESLGEGFRPAGAALLAPAWRVRSATSAANGQQVSVPIVGGADLAGSTARPSAHARYVMFADTVLSDDMLERLVGSGNLAWQVHERDNLKAGIRSPLAARRKCWATDLLGRVGYHRSAKTAVGATIPA